ncbi:MAG: hypothetical protein IPH11_10090 [Ignavibacteriales bacterium]|nr:hypothetical protein [Ignavibacteriales bacterium]
MEIVLMLRMMLKSYGMGFAVVGYTKSIPVTNYDVWLLRTDSKRVTLFGLELTEVMETNMATQ